MNYLKGPLPSESALAVFSIMPGATRSQDAVVVFNPRDNAVPIPCQYMDFPSIDALKEKFNIPYWPGSKQFLVIDPLAEDDPLVQSRLTSYLALGDASVYKMVVMSERLIYARKLPVTVDAEVLAQGRAIYVETKRNQNLPAEPVESASDAQNKDEGMISRAWNFMRARGG